MASWVEKVTKRFSTIPPSARENDFYAPYNRLFFRRLPNYTVLDLHDPVVRSPSEALEDKLVLFAEIKEPRELTLKSTREEADNQTRKRVGHLAPSCPLDTLNGVSAFGTRLTFYTYDKQTRTLPSGISPDPEP